MAHIELIVFRRISHLHKNVAKHEKLVGGSQPYWYKDNIKERRINHMSFNNLLFLHEL